MALTGGAFACACRRLTPTGMSPQIDLSLTDEYPMAKLVIISAVSAT